MPFWGDQERPAAFSASSPPLPLMSFLKSAGPLSPPSWVLNRILLRSREQIRLPKTGAGALAFGNRDAPGFVASEWTASSGALGNEDSRPWSCLVVDACEASRFEISRVEDPPSAVRVSDCQILDLSFSVERDRDVEREGHGEWQGRSSHLWDCVRGDDVELPLECSVPFNFVGSFTMLISFRVQLACLRCGSVFDAAASVPVSAAVSETEGPSPSSSGGSASSASSRTIVTEGEGEEGASRGSKETKGRDREGGHGSGVPLEGQGESETARRCSVCGIVLRLPEVVRGVRGAKRLNGSGSCLGVRVSALMLFEDSAGVVLPCLLNGEEAVAVLTEVARKGEGGKGNSRHDSSVTLSNIRSLLLLAALLRQGALMEVFEVHSGSLRGPFFEDSSFPSRLSLLASLWGFTDLEAEQLGTLALQLRKALVGLREASWNSIFPLKIAEVEMEAQLLPLETESRKKSPGSVHAGERERESAVILEAQAWRFLDRGEGRKPGRWGYLEKQRVWAKELDRVTSFMARLSNDFQV
uniref:Uncharacterized protein n=1 Tax=Chromera velia CCMP2878 TaxID=1169474 RepID=A0A0G4HJ40_9ALVE|eukprot:Cvel_28129.t1-p1 / transcript=Cvel_28129.t1 / gene=Cvel_28129 / organism=Chromera_velia_CCMP2878 / gene_product=hypothetical protein / transcript_product=hypothetical protein / location=Cvel_scaffold3629:403-2428(+) / protein_length=527 / sequence_SO=supercontig / SO=protein_coding / is_pseudo=false